MILGRRGTSMEDKKMNQVIPTGEYARLKRDYRGESRNFSVGQRVKVVEVVGHGAFLVVSVLGYRFSLHPGFLEPC